MTLHQLEIWIAVTKNQNVTKTADELHIRQPSASQQIKSLENDYGIKLYKVNAGKGIELTQAGKLLLKNAKLILLQVKILESKLKSSRKRRGRRR
ncbi:MAG: LysR family transcriptional regulator [Candidatus Dadabacteria bacterium]|nr:LysR family transcriptional regulator [Candidatus Dadabacteria bacterium]